MEKKVPFNMNYRPEIESGKYKVVTRDGRAVRIVCWDATEEYPLIVLFAGGSARPAEYPSDGVSTIYKNCDLFVVTGEEEKGGFKSTLRDCIFQALHIYASLGISVVDASTVTTIAERYAGLYSDTLLGLARAELDERSLRLGMEAQRKLDEGMPVDPTKKK